MDIFEASPVTVQESAEHHDTVRHTRRTASAVLDRPGALASLLISFLFCLIASFALVALMQLLNLLVWQITEIPRFSGFWKVWEILYWVIGGAGTLFVVLPLWLGRLRLAGRLLTDAHPEDRELFYWFSSAKRYGRALRILLIAMLQVTIPVTACGFAVKGTLAFYSLLASVGLNGIAVGVLIVGLCLTLGIAMLLLFWSGLWMLFTAVAVGNEKLSLRQVMGLALRGGRRVGMLFRFSLVSLKDLCLSVLTVGILFLLRYAHLYILSYLRLAMTLCPKGDG